MDYKDNGKENGNYYCGVLERGLKTAGEPSRFVCGSLSELLVSGQVYRGKRHGRSQQARKAWVAVKELKLSYYCIYIYIYTPIMIT